MKRRIGSLRGYPIIEGDKNLKTNNEIHISDLGGSGSGSADSKWEYYKIDRSNASYNYYVLGNVFNYSTLINEKYDGMVYIGPRGISFENAAAIAGISVKNIVGESVIDTGSWLSDIKEIDKLFDANFDYSFLTPITEEEFYSDNFDYPAPAPEPE